MWQITKTWEEISGVYIEQDTIVIKCYEGGNLSLRPKQESSRLVGVGPCDLLLSCVLLCYVVPRDYAKRCLHPRKFRTIGEKIPWWKMVLILCWVMLRSVRVRR